MKGLKIKILIELASKAARGVDNIKEGAIGSNGYGFIFRNFDYTSENSFLIGDGSSGFCSIGAYKHIYNKSLRSQEVTSKDLEELYNFNPKLDLYFGGR